MALYTAIIGAIVSIVISAAAAGIQYALRKKPQGQHLRDVGLRAEEFLSSTGSRYGAIIPYIYGTVRLPTNLVYESQVREIKKIEVLSQSVEVGKDSVTNETEVITFFYKCDIVLQICKGPITGGICKIFADKQLIYCNVDDEPSVKFKRGTFTLYKGNGHQTLPSYVPTNYRDTVCLLIEDFDMTFFGNRIPIFEVIISANGTVNSETQHVTTALVSAVDIISDICERTGMSAADYNVSDITAEFVGYVTPAGPVANALNPIITASKAISIYSDDKIKFRGRAVDPVCTIPDADLRFIGDGDSADDPKILMIRSDEKTLPSEISVNFFSGKRDHDPSSQTSRLNSPVYINEMVVDLPIVMSAAEAARLSEIFLYSVWQERITYKLALGPKYLFLEPGDAVLVDSSYGLISMIVTKIDYGANSTLLIEATSYNRGTYLSNKTGEEWAVNNSGDRPITNSTFQFFNAPMIESDHNTGGVYVFVNGATPSEFEYTDIYLSRNAVDYEFIRRAYSNGMFGTASTVLADAPAQLIDYVSTVQVVINDGQMVSATMDELLSNPTLNLFFIGDEVLQAADIELIGANTYVLSTLLRGRFGTEHYTGSHSAGEKVALYGTGYYLPLDGAGDYNNTLYIKLASSGQPFSAVSTVHSFVSDFRTLLPYSPVNVDAFLSGADIIIIWNRRSRSGDMLSSTGGELPLYEVAESYQVDILNSSGGLVRTLSSSTPTATYTAAQQAADGGVTTLRCKVYQLSAQIGRGTPSQLLVKTL